MKNIHELLVSLVVLALVFEAFRLALTNPSGFSTIATASGSSIAGLTKVLTGNSGGSGVGAGGSLAGGIG